MLATGTPYTPATALQQIGMQRNLHLFMHGYEAWADWRRTGFPINLATPGGTPVPLRKSYPANEVFNNGDNYRAAVQAQYNGLNSQAGKVWWNKP